MKALLLLVGFLAVCVLGYVMMEKVDCFMEQIRQQPDPPEKPQTDSAWKEKFVG